MAVRCVLVLPEGPSRRVGPSGILIGRQGDCDIVAADPSISRRHAHVRLTPDGVEVVPPGVHPWTSTARRTCGRACSPTATSYACPG